jgi:AraC-like DNA-binding protein
VSLDPAREAGTSFRAVSHAASIGAAKRMLLETDRKLTAIAVALGYHSLQSFSASFRRATGLTPSAYRGNQRGTVRQYSR